ncbi:MAG: ATP-binding cassette domain-containing protein [Desulfurococcaceae archaeon]
MTRIYYNRLTVKRGCREVITDLTAEMPGPGLYQVVGPNSVGKTTLILATLGALKPQSGSIHVEPGVDEGGVSYMPQDFNIPMEAPISTYEFVRNYLDLWRRKHGIKVDLNTRTSEILEMVGVPRSLWSERLTRLSGGMVRRALLARTLAPNTPILLLDEPLTGVDPEGKVDIAELLGELSKRKLIVMTNHDPLLVLDYTKKMLLLGYNHYVYGEPSELMKYEVLSKFYKKCAIEIERHVHVVDWH